MILTPIISRFRLTWTAPRQWKLACVAALLLVGPFTGPAHAELTKEYQLKAAFLYNFTRFVNWPPERFPEKESPIVIGIWGTNPFGEELEKIVAERKINGRAITVRTVSSPADARSVHLMFVSAAETSRLDETLAQLHDAHVLTVGESQPFAAAAGIITFKLEGDKLRFAINLKASEQAGIKISAQLLKLAITVRR